MVTHRFIYPHSFNEIMAQQTVPEILPVKETILHIKAQLKQLLAQCQADAILEFNLRSAHWCLHVCEVTMALQDKEDAAAFDRR
jgi:hypothetical protein